MKEDILEQIVDEYLMHQGYFTIHNVRFRPDPSDPEYISNQDSVSSDIDVLAIHPLKAGVERVVAVSCKSWQGGFDPRATLQKISKGEKAGAREAWKSYRELCKPKWARAFIKAIEDRTGVREFCYWMAVTKLTPKAMREDWENNPDFKKSMEDNPIKVITLADMLDRLWPENSTTPAATELGRMLQLMKAARWSPSQD